MIKIYLKRDLYVGFNGGVCYISFSNNSLHNISKCWSSLYEAHEEKNELFNEILPQLTTCTTLTTF